MVWATTLLALFLLGALPGIAGAQPAAGVITTVAGTGVGGYSGDDGPATTAQLSSPFGVATDTAGNLYIADYSNRVVRKVTVATGVITTVAGTGTYGSSGDNGPATAAQLRGPIYVTLDAAGNLYISDYNSNEVRKVTAATGIITTVAGTGTRGYNGDGIRAVTAQLDSPWGLAVDGAGDLYIADRANLRIRKVSAETGPISTFTGTGSPGCTGNGGPATAMDLGQALRLGLDTAGILDIGDSSNYRVRKVDAATGIITTIAGNGTAGYSGDGGPATAAQTRELYGVDVDAGGSLYIADVYNHVIRRVGGGTAPPADGAPYTLTVTPPTGGRIQGAGINCGAGGTACSVTMPAQMTLGLAATPSAGYTFGGWTGHCTGSSPSLWLDLKGARTCSATFTPVR